MNCGGAGNRGWRWRSVPAGSNTRVSTRGSSDRHGEFKLPVASGASRTIQSSPPTLYRSESTVTHPTTANVPAHNTNMPEVKAADRQNGHLDAARKLYSDGKFKAALAAFKQASLQSYTESMTNALLTHSFKALLRCPCTRDVLVQSKKMGLSLKEIQISRCHCKVFESLSTSDSPRLAMYTLAKRPCTCGSGVLHCNVASHLNALDGIIATYEKLEAPAKARQYATLFIITSPRSPEGYLRLAKAIRLCDTEKSPHTISRCRWIYRQATQSVQTYGNKDHTKLKALAGLLRMDIVGSVPAELRTMILQNLDNLDLCRSMRVSKAWKGACLDPSLWRHLTFAKSPGRNLRKGVFNQIISKRAQGKVKSLTLRDVSKLGIDLPIFRATLKLLSQLESLSLTGLSSIEVEEINWWAAPPLDAWCSILFEEAPRCLKTLHIEGFSPFFSRSTLSAPSEIPMAQSLEELRISHMSNSRSIIWTPLCLTAWPKLRKLTITPLDQRQPLRVALWRLAPATPSLKDLCIHSLEPGLGNSTISWENLERLELTFEIRDRIGGNFGVPGTSCVPPLCSTIRSLEFPHRAFEVLDAYEKTSQAYPQTAPNSSTLPPVTELARLEHLYLRDTTYQSHRVEHDLPVLSWFTELIEPSMSNGSLTSLAITFSPDMQLAFDKVLYKPAIRTLSCFDFIDQEHGSRCGDTFAAWVRGFTNLNTVGVFPQKTESCWMHVMKVLSAESRIETIYTDVLTGVWRDEALRKADEKGIKIIEASRIPEPVLQPLEP